VSSSAQIVARALKRINVVAAGEDPSAGDAADGLAALNAMIAGWAADGINVSPDVPLPSKHEEGVIALLAVRLAPDYGREPAALVYEAANEGMYRLEADYISAPLAQFDTALIDMPSRGLMTLTSVDDWVASTAYDLGDKVLADDRHIYQCIIAGTSGLAASEPHGTADEFLDGTVTWRFIGFNS
jgi:hypothetical protein